MTDAQAKLRPHEYVLREMLSTEVDFEKNMAFLAGLKSAADKKMQAEIGDFFEAAQQVVESSKAVQDLFKEAKDWVDKIAKKEVTEQQIKEHTKKLKKALTTHTNNIIKMVELYAQYDLKHYSNPALDAIVKDTKTGNNPDAFSGYSILCVQRLPRYVMFTEDLKKILKTTELNVSVEQVTMSPEFAKDVADKANKATAKGQMTRTKQVLSAIVDLSHKPTKKALEQASIELKSLIARGGDIDIKTKIQNDYGVSLNRVVVILSKAEKLGSVQLGAPVDTLKTPLSAANVLSGYIQSGFKLHFSDKDILETWGKKIGSSTPVKIDLPANLLDFAGIRQAMHTAKMLQDAGMKVEFSKSLLDGVDIIKNESHFFLNVVAKARQSAFKKEIKNINLGENTKQSVSMPSKSASAKSDEPISPQSPSIALLETRPSVILSEKSKSSKTKPKKEDKKESHEATKRLGFFKKLKK